MCGSANLPSAPKSAAKAVSEEGRARLEGWRDGYMYAAAKGAVARLPELARAQAYEHTDWRWMDEGKGWPEEDPQRYEDWHWMGHGKGWPVEQSYRKGKGGKGVSDDAWDEDAWAPAAAYSRRQVMAPLGGRPYPHKPQGKGPHDRPAGSAPRPGLRHQDKERFTATPTEPPRAVPTIQEGDGVTTIMIKMHNTVSAVQLMAHIAQLGLGHAYDYVYVPMDRRAKVNKGYGFVNFATPAHALSYAQKVERGDLPLGKKQLVVIPAKAQGVAANLELMVSVNFGDGESCDFNHPWVQIDGTMTRTSAHVAYLHYGQGSSIARPSSA